MSLQPIELEGFDAFSARADKKRRMMPESKLNPVSFDVKSNEIRVYGDIFMYEEHVDELISELAQNPEANVTVAVNSRGGDSFLGVALFNALLRHKGEVTVRVDGIAASAASLIAMAGDKVVMAPGSFMMIHRSSVFTGGDAEELEETAAFMRRLDEAYASIYAARSGGDKETMLSAMAATTYYSASQAVENGMASEVEETLQLASMDVSDLPGTVPAELLQSAADAEDTAETEEQNDPVSEGGEDENLATDPDPDPTDDGQLELDFKAKLQEAAKTFASRAREITDLCALAHAPEKAGAYISSDKSVETIRAELITESTQTTALDTRRKADRPTPARFDSFDLTTKFHNRPRGDRRGAK